jgi:hypothetical protein
MFKKFKKEKEPENIQEILSSFRDLKNDFQKISSELEKLKKRSELAIQKTSMIRFNPYKDTGGNQSFSIALLDENNNGFIITSLYYREGNRVYAKPVSNGSSEYSLSKEEETALNKAKNIK